MKICATCKHKKDLVEFYKRCLNCKDCVNIGRRRLTICRHCKETYVPGKRGKGRFCGDKCRFMNKVDKDGLNGCWIWKGHIQKNRGYGTFLLTGWIKSGLAHRASFILFRNPNFDLNKNVLHKCDTPPCVNPLHLFEGLHQHNMDDMIAKGRSKFHHKGSENGSAKLKEEDIIEIRNLHTSGNMTYAELGRQFGVVSQTISGIVRKLMWKHI